MIQMQHLSFWAKSLEDGYYLLTLDWNAWQNSGKKAPIWTNNSICPKKLVYWKVFFFWYACLGKSHPSKIFRVFVKWVKHFVINFLDLSWNTWFLERDAIWIFKWVKRVTFTTSSTKDLFDQKIRWRNLMLIQKPSLVGGKTFWMSRKSFTHSFTRIF